MSIPVFGATEAERPVFDVACVDPYPVEVYEVAKVVWAEARGESLEGKIFLIDAVRNIAHEQGCSLFDATFRKRMKKGKIDQDLVALVAAQLDRKISHPYSFWINFQKATDREWADYARKQEGSLVGRHFFF